MNTTIVPFGTEIAPDVPDSSRIGSSVVGVPQTLGDLVAIWQETHPKEERMLRTTCVRLSDYLEAPVGEIRIDSLEQARNGFRPFLETRTFKEYSIRTYVNHLRIILNSATSAGWQQSEHLSEEWRRILALVSGRRGAALVHDLAAIRKTPQEVLIDDVDKWIRNVAQKELSYHWAVGIGNRFWRVLRDCGYPNQLPLSIQRDKDYGIAIRDFPIKLRDETTELLCWKETPYIWDRPKGAHLRPATAKLLRHMICQLYGFAVNIRHETDIASLPQLVQRHIVGAFVQWCITVRKVKGQTLKQTLRLIDAAMRQHPRYEGVKLDWFKPLLDGIPTDPDSVLEKRKAGKCVEYSVIQAIPAKIHEQRPKAAKRGRKQLAVVVRDELIIRWLSVLPWRQLNLRECRIGGPTPNLYKGPVAAITTIDMPNWAIEERQRNPEVLLWQFHFTENETKTECAVDALVPRQLIGPLEEYLTHFRKDLVSGDDPGTLLLNQEGGHMNLDVLTKVVATNTLKHGGRRVTPHPFRDIVCRAWLKDHPKDYLTLSKLLWHSTPDQVIKTYGSLFNESSGVCAMESWLEEREAKSK